MGCSGSKIETEVSPNKTNPDMMEFKFELHEKTVEQFLVLQREINAYERRHIPETLQVRHDQMQQLKKTLQRMEQDFVVVQRDIAQQTPIKGKRNDEATEKSVRNFLLGQDKYDELTAFEKADHLATLNKNEILRKEIDGTKHHVVELQQEIDILEDDMKDLSELYENEDKLLDSLFHGEYGSDRENFLEEQLDSLEMKLQKIEEANFKWRQAQVMIEYACKQIGTAVERWEDIIKTPFGNMEARYKLAEETRNNLIAAGQNIQGAQRYLPHIKFPYCTPEEVNMLNKATSYVFTDMQAKARQAHALDVYGAAHKRAAALLQWFNETINKTIKNDLMGVKDKVKVTSTQLRQERVELIKYLVKQQYGKDIETKSADINLDDDSEHDFDLDSTGKNHDSSGLSQRGSYSDLSYNALPNAPSPIPLEDLAPQPTRDDLFGKLDELTKQHQQQVQRMTNGMTVNKLRTQRDLDNKLTRRKERRLRARHHAQQEQEILQHVTEHVDVPMANGGGGVAFKNGEEKMMNNNNNYNNINNHHHQQQRKQQQQQQQQQPSPQQYRQQHPGRMPHQVEIRADHNRPGQTRPGQTRIPHQLEDRLEDVDGEEIMGRPIRNARRY